MTESLRFLTEWFDRVWHRGEEGAIAEMMSSECEAGGLGAPVRGPEAYRAFVGNFRRTFAETRVEIVESAGDDQKIVGLARFTAKHRTTGAPVDTMFGFSAEIRDGQIVRASNVVDFHTLLTQIGAVPGGVLEQALTEG